MPKVFILSKTDRYDYSNAEKFGELVYLLEDSISPFNVNEHIYIVSSMLQNNFDNEKDYICMTGNTLSLCWLSIAMSNLFTKINLLLFDSKTETYVERKLELPKRRQKCVKR